MHCLKDEIRKFLEENGFECSLQIRNDLEVICTKTADGRYAKTVLPLEINALSPEDAAIESDLALEAINMIKHLDGSPVVITEDRWKKQPEMMQSRLLAHLELFGTVYARNCEVRKIDKHEAEEFLKACHSYGYSACRYRYGMFLKRNTGSISTLNGIEPGTLIAVSTFSNARKWNKDGKIICSYEWTRFASLPFLRISGGMSKMLKTFIREVCPDDIMSYADLEWSEGEAYRKAGFIREGWKDPVMFVIDGNWDRIPIKKLPDPTGSHRYFRNFGSSKFRLKLTDYK